MNPQAALPSLPFALLGSPRSNQSLVYNLSWREVTRRRCGSLLGLLGFFFNPELMLAVPVHS